MTMTMTDQTKTKLKPKPNSKLQSTVSCDLFTMENIHLTGPFTITVTRFREILAAIFAMIHAAIVRSFSVLCECYLTTSFVGGMER